MPNATVRASAQAMPMNRRGALSALFAAGAAFAAPRALHAAESDAELLALSDEILRRCAEAVRFREERIDPYDPHFLDLIHDETRDWEARSTEAFAYSEQTGRDAAIVVHGEFEEATDKIFDRMMAIPARTQAGRAAKVRALLVHVMRSEWRGPAAELDWEKEQARALLGEFAGLTPDELEAI